MTPQIAAAAHLPPASKTLLADYLKTPQLLLVRSQGSVWRFVKSAISTSLAQKSAISVVAFFRLKQQWQT
jgi:hypothetical protein